PLALALEERALFPESAASRRCGGLRQPRRLGLRFSAHLPHPPGRAALPDARLPARRLGHGGPAPAPALAAAGTLRVPGTPLQPHPPARPAAGSLGHRHSGLAKWRDALAPPPVPRKPGPPRR